MKNSPKKFFIISLALAGVFSVLFIFVAENKEGVEKFDSYLGAIWVFILSFIVVLSLAQLFKKSSL